MSYSDYTVQDPEEVLGQLKTSKSGLSGEMVSKRQRQYGLNELPAEKFHWWNVLFRQFKSSFLYLLLAAALLSFFLGETLDGLMILLFVAINTLLGFYQEYKSELTLKLLKQYIVSKVKVWRGNQETTIGGAELTIGDIVICEPGLIIPADLRLIETQNLTIDESALTGESTPVEKQYQKLKNETQAIHEAKNLGFLGTSVTSGKGLGVVLGIGKDTALGQIASLTAETKHESPFEKSLSQFSVFVLKLIILTLIFVILANILIKGDSVNITTLIIFAIALAVSVIPEALLVVTTFSLSRGALNLAKNKVVVKRLAAIEDLGSIEVLCTDKTGTITENKLTVAEVYPQDGKKLLLYASLATPQEQQAEAFTDSFDAALWKALSSEDKILWKQWEKLDEVPFDPERKRNSVLAGHNGYHKLIVRGAPEIIIQLCRDLNEEGRKNLNNWLKSQGNQGKRTIAVAEKNFSQKISTELVREEKDLKFVGLISFTDPLKKTAQEAILKAEKLGVKIKILTGDSKEVAGAIGCTIGLIKDPHSALTGEQFDSLPLEKQRESVEKFSVFARVSPSQKYKIVKLLQEKYEVGFLGEGINDAPALKAANVSLVVQGAADIAREASDIILLNKSLNIIVEGIQEGREVFANTAKYIKSTLSSNFGNFYTIALVSLFIKFLPLLPLQILLINLLTDFPMIAVVTDNIDPDELKKPKNYNVKEIALLATCLGVVSAIFDFAFFLLFYRISPQVLQTNWFIGSVLTELVFLFSIRTRFFMFKAKRPSAVLLFLTALTFAVTLLLPYTQFGRQVFSFVSPSLNHLFMILGIVGLYLIATEAVKLFYYQITKVSYKAEVG